MDKLIRRIVTSLLAGSVALAGCSAETIDGKDEPGADADGKADRWNATNDPNRFGGGLNYAVAELPREGRSARAAWPSTYWPTYADSINHRWNDGELSPAEKYDVAFNGWMPTPEFMALRPFVAGTTCGDNVSGFDRAYYDGLGPLARHISANMGNLRSRDGRDSDGDGAVDECDDNDGVESWWGLCHAWVPAAMLEDAPQRSVTHNGVTFHVGDLQALMIAAYNRAPADMIGGRCNDGTMDTPVERDAQGRPVDVECRDSNPGAFHVIMTNFLGLQQRPYAEDRTYDYEVWNQPVVAFRVSKLEEITIARANELLGLTGDTYTFNADAAKLYEVEATSTYITESHASVTPPDPSAYERQDRYTYILEVDARGKIIGGEWYGASRTNHPDFLWNPRRLTRSSVPSLDINQVRMLIAMSREAPGGGGSTGGTAREFAGRGGIAIPDNNTTGVTSTATVGEALGIGGIQVALDITHTYVGDLKITLAHAGTERTIWNNEGGSDDNINTTINVAGFSGDASGEWVLKVVDSAGQDVGRINGWRLLVTPSGTTIGGGGTGGTAGTFPGDASGTAIPDNNTTGIRSTATVPAGTTGTVTVSVNLTHPYVGDLIVKLTHGSQSWTLHNRAGGSADNIVRTFSLDPRPSGDLAGAWTLQVQDRAADDVGTLNSWSVIVAR